jgi:NADPH-dependent curcumin reductase
MTEKTAQRVVLAAPIVGVPRPSDFRLELFRVPALIDGQFLIRNVFCSVDPGTRSRLSPGVSYTTPLKAGEMISSFALGQVQHSSHPGFVVGDWLVHASGWSQYQVSDGRGYFQKLEPKWVESGLSADKGGPGVPLSAWIGVLGIPGMTAWFGMTRIGAVAEGARVLVSSAAGPVGASAGQIARRFGATNVVGIAGGIAKCKWLKQEAHFDHAIDYQSVRAASSNDDQYVAQLQAQLQAASPDGYDILFDNVGNTLIDIAIPLLRPHARIVISGQVADYNRSADEMPGLFNTRHFIAKRLRMEGILVFDDRKQFATAQNQIADWILQRQFAWKEERYEGIERMPEAFIGLFAGERFGRRIVQVGSVED